eukprot:NODE_2701_length_1513_cov_50.327338_g2327_i0.p1 GENE.NODE_2701_length_1513_cov_50.327338_g2327_i0~~NODE_2701_length_1513_cov_50.327338_g2327_i0.p1  ORF type:complete len:476 (+),score=59.12 NODE_2701_length_1513_cov_50.327338_g2327_i0:75-1502(+)
MSKLSRSSSSGYDDSADDSEKDTQVAPPPPGYATVPYIKEDTFVEEFYKPHTVTIGLLALTLIVYIAFNRNETDHESNVRWGFLAVCIAFLLFCAVHLPDGLLLRPHPAVWRVVLGVALIYLIILVYFLFQPVASARSILGFFDPSLNHPLPERSYASDCRIYTPDNPHSNFANIMDTLNDEFILAHILGHWGKGVMVRNWRICLALSIGFEIVEVTFQHALPNYAECWWDHVLIDILICNAVGCWLGLKTCAYFGAKDYNWVGLREIKSYRAKVARMVTQFTPIGWVPYEWRMFRSFKRFMYCMTIIILVNIVDNNAFFLKYILWIPPPHFLNPLRLFVWWFLALPTLREFYQFVTDSACKRLGTNSWVALGICGLEVLIIFKWSWEENIFSTPFPTYIYYPWILSITIWTTWCILYFSTIRLHKRNFWLNIHLEVLFYLGFVPMLFLFVAGCPDLQWGREWFQSIILELGLPP